MLRVGLSGGIGSGKSTVARALADRGVVVIVEAPEAVRLERLVGRGMAPDDARRRMAAQASDAERRAVADVIVDNSGTPEDLEAQIEGLWLQLSSSLRA